MATRTVLEKLGLREGMKTRIVDLPDDLADMFAPALQAVGEPAEWHFIFVSDMASIARAAAEDVPKYARGQHLWVGYPKKSSGVKTDTHRDEGWDAFKAADLYGVMQISVTPIWSALRFRYRDEIRNFTRKF
jgi:hypothetical protein